jgi:hypothetical protein
MSSIQKRIENRMIIKKLIDKNYKNIERLNLLGKGDFGMVYKCCSREDGRVYEYAVKYSKLKKEALKELYGLSHTSWVEYNILSHLCNSIINNKICPNVPFLIESFHKRKKKLELRKNVETSPCVITIVELAQGNLKDFLKTNPSSKEIYVALFQIMAGIYALQKYGQIMNYDIKQENILYYNVEKGGYWIYEIFKQKYYIPNYGKIFVINDFGISRSMSPYFQTYRELDDKTFRLGCRFGIIIDDVISPLTSRFEPNSDGVLKKSDLVRFENDNGDVDEIKCSQFRLNKKSQMVYDNKTVLTQKQKDFLKKISQSDTKNLDFFNYPDIIPPFEFYNDTQDGIRMFLGGKRSTQSGNHKKHDCIPLSLKASLKKYVFKAENSDERYFPTNPAKICAGYFIKSFFNTEYTNYLKPFETVEQKSNGKLIEEYIM